MDENDRRKFDAEKQLQSDSHTIEALGRLFGPVLNITKDWPPLLAYGALFAVLIVVLVLLHAAVPVQLFWLLCAVFGAVLVAFVLTDRGVRGKRRQSTGAGADRLADALPAGSSGQANAQLADAAQGWRAGRGTSLLYCVSGDFASEQMEIPVDGMYVGRDPAKVNLVLRSDQISGVHVRVWPEPNSTQVWVEDWNSLNGTFYCQPGAGGGSRSEWIPLQGKVLLGNGARFRLGSGIAEFEIKTA